MPKTSQYYSLHEGVHHTNTECSIGKAIKEEDRKQGTGAKPVCQECLKLNIQGK